eukprot:jgi/Phyca11/132895/e_gw1.255.4.1
MELLEVAGKGLFSDATFAALLEKLFCGPNVVYINPTTMLVVVDGAISINTDGLAKMLFGMSDEMVLIPINCNGIHWCSIMIKLATAEILLYDPMSSSYMANVRDVAQVLIPLLPGSSRYRIRNYESELGMQHDSYNCGLFVLLSFEMFCGANTPGKRSKRLLQYLRYRYLCMCF